LAEKIGARLMQVRKSVDLTQAEFAEKLGVSPRAYSGYELDERDLPVSIVVKLHESFNVSANWLLLGEGAQNSEDLAQFVEDATIATLEFLDEENLSPPREKTVKMIRHLFNYRRKMGDISKEYRDDYMRSAL
jgi:transcriptional regulator with XRE-family HTH domain